MKDAALVEVFTLARQEIEARNHKYICDAIVFLPAVSSTLMNKARNIIHRRLGGYNSYESWLWAHHAHLMHDAPKYLVEAKTRQARLDWLDSLIKEFS